MVLSAGITKFKPLLAKCTTKLKGKDTVRFAMLAGNHNLQHKKPHILHSASALKSRIQV